MKVVTWLQQITPDATSADRHLLLKVAWWLCLLCRDDEPLFEDDFYKGRVWHRNPHRNDEGTPCDADNLWVEIRAGRLP